MPEHHHSGKRRTLFRSVRLGTVFLAGWGLSLSTKTSSGTPPKSTRTTVAGTVSSDKPIPANPERLIRADASLTEPLDHALFNPATKRKIGIRIRLPVVKEKTGLIIYSPGLGSGLNNGATWCEAWRKAGFVVVTLSHTVTNEDIWDTSKKSLKSNLRDALAFPQYGLRVTDCKFVFDICLADSDLKSFIDHERIGIAGHSYGALTAQSIAGQSNGANLTDPRIKAAIAFSPTAISVVAANAMKTVKIPFFCITSDHDDHVTFKNGTESMRLGIELTKRKSVYKGLPPGKREQLVLANADHRSFAGEDLSATPPKFSRDIKTNAEQENKTWQKISQVTTLFWLAHLRKTTSEADLKKYREAVALKLGNEDEYRAD